MLTITAVWFTAVRQYQCIYNLMISALCTLLSHFNVLYPISDSEKLLELSLTALREV